MLSSAPRQLPPSDERSTGVPVAVVGQVWSTPVWLQMSAPFPEPVVPMIEAVFTTCQMTPRVLPLVMSPAICSSPFCNGQVSGGHTAHTPGLTEPVQLALEVQLEPLAVLHVPPPPQSSSTPQLIPGVVPPAHVPTPQKQVNPLQSPPITNARSIVSCNLKPPACDAPENVCSVGLLHTLGCGWFEPLQKIAWVARAVGVTTGVGVGVPGPVVLVGTGVNGGSMQDCSTLPVGSTNVLMQVGSEGNPMLGLPPTLVLFVSWSICTRLS